MAVGYAAFNTTLTITGTSNITSEWNVVFTSITQVSKTSGVTIVSNPVVNGTSATFDVGLALPGDKIVYEITIENKGTINAIIENIVASASDSPAIIFSMEGVNIGDKIPNKTSKTLTVTIEYDKNVTSQPEKTNKVLTVDMTVVQDAGQTITPVTPDINQPLYLSGAILKDNVAQVDTNINFRAVNEKGLYYTSTNTEGGKTTYYFRGAVENNYVQFGKYSNDLYYGYDSDGYMKVFNNLSDCQNNSDYNTNCTKIRSAGDSILWRIIRINEDGSIRLITEDTVETSMFNETPTLDNAYVGYMYGTPGSDTYEETHANEHDSVIKAVVDTWYVNNLSSYSGYLADAGFCNDRSVYSGTGIGTASTTYEPYNRLGYEYNQTTNPIFKCPNEERDLFTMASSVEGNKSLAYPIGLMSADEMIYAGLSPVDYSPLYLKNANDNEFRDMFAMTALKRPSRGTGIFYWDGGFATSLSPSTFDVGVRPVINLRSNVEITRGNGTSTNPYIIK